MFKKSSKLLSLLLVVVMIAAVMSGCGSKSASTTSKKSNTLVVGIDMSPSGLDPQKATAASSLRIIRQLYSSLLKYDSKMELTGDLAEKWEQTDATTYVFHLRKGVKFHNGREMTATDVKYSFDRIKDPKTAAIAKSTFKKVKSVDVVDNYTVKVTLDKPYAPFLAKLTESSTSIVCKEVVDKNGGLQQVECGTGPFVLKEMVQDSYIKLAKNPDYFIKGEPKVDGITYSIMKDESSRLAAVRTGQINITKLSAQTVALAKKDSKLKVISFPANLYSYLAFNMTIKPFNNIKVRQAISLAIDRDAIGKTVYNGDAVVSGPVPPTLPQWTIDVTQESMYKTDINAAKKLLADAGYANGFTTEITVDSSYSDYIAMAQKIQQQLAQIGITAKIKQLEEGQYIDAWLNKKHQMMVGGNGAGTDPDRSLGFFFSTTGTANVWGYSDPAFDKLIEQGQVETDQAKRVEIYKQAQKMLINDCPNIFIDVPKDYYVTTNNVEGFNPSTYDAENFNETTLK